MINCSNSSVALSIIVPAYGVESYIEKCLDSILLQDGCAEYCEVIIVDDGAKDRSGVIADEYALRYSNVQVIHQENSGLSAARNSGILIARGDYIWFVDGDDFVTNGCLCSLIEFIKSRSNDIVMIDYNRLTNTGITTESVPADLRGVELRGSECLLRRGAGQAWRHLYSLEFLRRNELLFSVGMLHEDSEFNARAKVLAASICHYELVCYNYYAQRDGSIMNITSLNHINDLLSYPRRLISFGVKRDLPQSDMVPLMACAAGAVKMAMLRSSLLPEALMPGYFETLRAEREMIITSLWHSRVIKNLALSVLLRLALMPMARIYRRYSVAKTAGF